MSDVFASCVNFTVCYLREFVRVYSDRLSVNLQTVVNSLNFHEIFGTAGFVTMRPTDHIQGMIWF